MSYNRTNWHDGDVITQVRLNNIENGIENLDTQYNDIKNETIPTMQGELTANVLNAMNVSNNLLNNKYRIKSYHRDFYIENGYVKTLQISDSKKMCWFYLLDSDYIKYTINKDTKWALIGFGDNYEEYCIIVNLMGLTTRDVYKMDTSTSTSLSVSVKGWKSTSSIRNPMSFISAPGLEIRPNVTCSRKLD